MSVVVATVGTGGPSDEEREARLRVETYVAPVYSAPLTDDRKLSIRGACKAMQMSVNTLYRYGLDQRLQAAETHREEARAKAGLGAGSATDKALACLRKERDYWRQQYETLAEVHLHLQAALRLEPGVDIKRVLARRLPKAVRNAPGRGRRRGGRGMPRGGR